MKTHKVLFWLAMAVAMVVSYFSIHNVYARWVTVAVFPIWFGLSLLFGMLAAAFARSSYDNTSHAPDINVKKIQSDYLVGSLIEALIVSGLILAIAVITVNVSAYTIYWQGIGTTIAIIISSRLIASRREANEAIEILES